MELSRRTLLGAGAGLAGAGLAGSTFGASAAAAPSAESPTDGLTVLYETSFEDNESHWVTSSSDYDATTSRTGARSLRYSRTDIDHYELAKFEIEAEPGREYRMSAWAKVADLAGHDERGASLAIDAWNASGGWISGGYSVRGRGEDWTWQEVVYVAPAAATRLVCGVYLHKGMTGTVWFDDLVLGMVPLEPMTTELLTPSYRGWLIPGDYDEVALRARINLSEAQLETHTVTISLVDAAGTATGEQVFPAAAEVDYTHPASELDVGAYAVRAVLSDAAGAVVATDEWNIEKLAEVPATYVDRHRRLIREGEPFFPLGFYEGLLTASRVEELAGTPFNTLLSYSTAMDATQLDLAAANGLTVIASFKDYYYNTPGGPDDIVTEEDEIPAILARIDQIKDHPAVLAWYLYDELSPGIHGEQMIAHQEAVAAHDPDHPTYAITNTIPTPASTYLRTMDVFGNDSYPIRDDNSRVSGPTQRAAGSAAVMPYRAMWHVPQSYARGSMASDTGRFPTAAEFRNMSWQFICEGATGLIYYHFFYMFRDPDLTFAECMAIAMATGTEVSELVPVLLSIDPAPEVSVPEADWLNHLVKADGDTGFLFTVNHTRDAQSASFVVPAAYRVSVRGEDRSLEVGPDGSFTDAYEPLAVHHYEIELASWQVLGRATADSLSATGAPGQDGLSTSLGRLLQRAEAMASADRRDAANALLEEYRTRVAGLSGRALTEAQAATLLRLSQQL